MSGVLPGWRKIEENHLAVLAANIDESAYLRIFFLNPFGGGDDFLHEPCADFLGVTHSYRASYYGACIYVAKFFGYFCERFRQRIDHIGVVSSVFRKQNVVVVVEDYGFYSC